MSTLTIPPVIPSPREDAKNLNKAFRGIGCDTSTVINILAHRNSDQIELIQQEYDNKYDALRKRISSELHGHFRKAVCLWLREPTARDANVLKHALRGAVTDYKAASDVICSRTPAQLRRLNQVYLSQCGARLQYDIENQTHGDLKKLLLAYLNITRYEGPEIDAVSVEADAKAIHKGADSKLFIHIFTERSRAHMSALISVYSGLYGTPLEQTIKKETPASLKHALLTILRFVDNPAMYFARVLRKAMNRIGTDDSALIWVIITRAEIDMQYIKAEYRKKYGKTLNEAVYSETSGNYRAFLLSLLGTNC
ncbi:Annexin [Melia azedarach]|uniref:Annexin n=1 Tax=Melia azedarach TaxID=155640 RepID=A0ACC1XH49_MELAZ|nr:Annexin [Melia azedarach]